jgi:membrane protein YqaA with SNARE-associated domain
MAMFKPIFRLPLYLWALPTTIVGLCFLPLTLLDRRSRVAVVDGVLELHGPAIAFLLRHCTLLPGGASAITFGHVVLARDAQSHERTRDHERVHVRQCERWGPFFIPAYLTASLVAKLRGGNAYRDNVFEREAYESTDAA